MALVRGCHVIAKGDQTLAPGTAWKIIQSRGLLINNAGWGTGAYAFYLDMVPSHRSLEPMVVFDVDEQYVTKRIAPLPTKHGFAFMQMYRHGLSYIPIYILGFVNLPNFPAYPHPLGVF